MGTTVPGRLAALDQFRGYTVAGMLLVNFLGSFDICPAILKHHHSYCSYADTIMPQFLFAVGFAARLGFRRAQQNGTTGSAYRRAIWRALGLLLVAVVLYTPSRGANTWAQLLDRGPTMLAAAFKRHWFQTLTHIAVTSLWILPVITARPLGRIAYLGLSAGLHVLLSDWFNFHWVNSDPNGIDGGPLGFLTWSVPALLGTLACDAFAGGEVRLIRWAVIALLFMGVGYFFSCGTRFYDVPPAHVAELAKVKLAARPVQALSDPLGLGIGPASPGGAEPPFFPPPGIEQRKWNYWMMSQRSGTLSYTTFAAGFALAVYLLFHVLCERFVWRPAVFTTFGGNALAVYILHDLVDGAVKPFFPDDSPTWYALLGFGLFFVIVWLMTRYLEKRGLFLRL